MYKKYFKRILDVFLALLILPLFLLVFIPVAILILLEDGGSVLYTATRLGRNQVPFKMYKFRSMKVNAPDIRLADGSTFNGKDDPRVTKIGRILRETSIDEIPQLFNVFLGHMSVIGPRPDMNSDEPYPEEYKSFLEARPGITGYNQAYYRNETNRLEKMKNDKYYVDHISFALDVRIFIQTIRVVIKRENLYKK